jgi:D-beta-D-heptose 7-phosphate kinase/D-beta-D-heptose 1-phosphate adenosyltransferase
MTQAGADCDGLVTLPDRPTVTKTRLLGSSEDKSPQQMIRLDREDASHVDDAVGDKLVAAALLAMEGADVVAIEDYNKGVLTPSVCQRVIAAARERHARAHAGSMARGGRIASRETGSRSDHPHAE